MGICSSKNKNSSNNQRSARIAPSLDNQISIIDKRLQEAQELPNVVEKIQNIANIIKQLSVLKQRHQGNEPLIALSSRAKTLLLLVVEPIASNEGLNTKEKLNIFAEIIKTSKKLMRTHLKHPILEQLVGATYYKMGNVYATHSDAVDPFPLIHKPYRQNAIVCFDKAIQYGYKKDEVETNLRLHQTLMWTSAEPIPSPSSSSTPNANSRALVFSVIAPTSQPTDFRGNSNDFVQTTKTKFANLIQK